MVDQKKFKTFYSGNHCLIEIVGCSEFILKVVPCLDLLKTTTYYFMVLKYLRCIHQAKSSYVAVWRKKPCFYIGEKSWRSDPKWLASAFVHEAVHCELYVQGKKKYLFFEHTPTLAFWGEEAERKCMLVQLDALYQLDADEYICNGLKKESIHPTHHLIPNHKRDW